MKLLSLALGLLGLVSAVTAQEAVLADRVLELKNPSTGVVKLTDANFNDIVGGPRDYAIAVLLTADGAQYGCGFCKIIGPVFSRLAASWNAGHPNGDGLYFGLADISENKAVYQQLGLTHAPSLWIYPPTDRRSPIANGYDQYVFPQNEEQIGQLREYLEKAHGFNIEVKEPFRWDRLGLLIGTAITIVAVIKLAGAQVLAILQSRQLWTAISLVAVLMFTAGHMFNMIRRTPYVIGDGNGNPVYFVGGHGNQIAVETQIIALVYATLAFATIALTLKIPRITNASTQGLAVTGLIALIWLAYSFLVAKFRIKNGGYPFKLLDIF